MSEQAQTAKIDAAREGLGRVQSHQGEDRFRDALTASGLTPEQVKRVTNRAEGLFEFDSTFRSRLSAVTETTARGSKERSDGYNDVSRQAFDQALREEKYTRDISAPVREARSKLSGIEGVDPLKIDETLRDPKKADAFIKALGAFDGGSNKIEDFGKRVEEANTKLAELRNELETVNATIKASGPAPAPVTRALGGSIFRPMGTDTVPAMLTPGEFVINARSAAANAALVQQINEARGPVSYRAEGGFMGPISETLTEEIEREIRERRAASEAISCRKAVSGLFGAAGGIASGVRRGDPVIADLRERLTLAAAQNPSGRSAQGFAQQSAIRNELNRQKRNPNSRLSDEAKSRRAEFAGDEAAGRFAVTAQATNFNRLSALNSGVRRPGDEGQKNIAARVIGVEQKGLEDRFARDQSLQRFVARRFATGGYVGHAGVGDRVPALLTGGEFVLNQAAVSRMGPHNVQRFNDGGPVGNPFGAQTNVPVAREQERRQSLELSDATVNRLSNAMTAFGQNAGRFGESAEQLSRTLNVFAGSARDLTQALNNMPKALTGQFTHSVVVTHNGAEVFSKLTPAIEQVVTERVNSALARAFKEHLPDAGISI